MYSSAEQASPSWILNKKNKCELKVSTLRDEPFPDTYFTFPVEQISVEIKIN